MFGEHTCLREIAFQRKIVYLIFIHHQSNFDNDNSDKDKDKDTERNSVVIGVGNTLTKILGSESFTRWLVMGCQR